MKVVLQNWVLRDLCNTLVYDEMLKAQNVSVRGVKVLEMTIGEDVIPELEARQIVEEAKVIKTRYTVLRRVNASMRTMATNMLVNKSKIVDDMVFAKAMLYTLDMQEKLLRDLSAL